MQKILVIANGAAYGNESLFNALRLAISLKETQNNIALTIFLMSDAVSSAILGQKPHEGYSIQQMLEILVQQKVMIKLCKTCTDARGITESLLIEGISIGTLQDLSNWVAEADKVLTF